MRQYMREVKKNLWKRYTQPESGDYAVVICVVMTIGLVISMLMKGGF